MEENKPNENAEEIGHSQSKPLFLIFFALVSALICAGCIIAYHAIGSYGTEDVGLLESIPFMPLALLFGFLAVITLIRLAARLIAKVSGRNTKDSAD